MHTINRDHKDRLFSFLFGSESNKEWTLSLYNAVNNTSYTDPQAILFTTIEDAVYMGMKNDLSFILFHVMNIYEQQSTYNPIHFPYLPPQKKPDQIGRASCRERV